MITKVKIEEPSSELFSGDSHGCGRGLAQGFANGCGRWDYSGFGRGSAWCGGENGIGLDRYLLTGVF